MNKCGVYVIWPFPSLVQTTECQGTTSQQHGCKDPRLKPLELLKPNRRNTTFKMWLQRKAGYSYTSGEKRVHLFLLREENATHEFEAQLQKWVIGAEACRRGPLLSPSTLSTISHHKHLIPQDVHQKAHPCTALSRIWWTPVLLVSAGGRVRSRTNGGDLKGNTYRRCSSTHHTQADIILSALLVSIFTWNCVLYLDHLQAHFPSKNAQKEKNIVIFKKYIPAGYLHLRANYTFTSLWMIPRSWMNPGITNRGHEVRTSDRNTNMMIKNTNPVQCPALPQRVEPPSPQTGPSVTSTCASHHGCSCCTLQREGDTSEIFDTEHVPWHRPMRTTEETA